jgi:putative ribosome biogenesis GTPase RsgA
MHNSSSDVLIAVMGMTGVGKSTFINYFADQKAEIGDHLESCKLTSIAKLLFQYCGLLHLTQ